MWDYKRALRALRQSVEKAEGGDPREVVPFHSLRVDAAMTLAAEEGRYQRERQGE